MQPFAASLFFFFSPLQALHDVLLEQSEQMTMGNLAPTAGTNLGSSVNEQHIIASCIILWAIQHDVVEIRKLILAILLDCILQSTCALRHVEHIRRGFGWEKTQPCMSLFQALSFFFHTQDTCRQSEANS